jgi:hypothetical protein
LSTNEQQKDNSTFRQKSELRTRALLELADDPVVLEAFGGFGKLYARCYAAVEQGVVFEKDSTKVAALARQRPTWAVYQADSTAAIRDGAGSHLPVNFLDLDPYGEPWPTLDAFFQGHKPKVPRLVIVVNDGLRQKLQAGGGWEVHSLAEVVAERGNCGLFQEYLSICKLLVQKKAAQAGYRLRRWNGYHCGRQGHMTHYAAVLERS